MPLVRWAQRNLLPFGGGFFSSQQCQSTQESIKRAVCAHAYLHSLPSSRRHAAFQSPALNALASSSASTSSWASFRSIPSLPYSSLSCTSSPLLSASTSSHTDLDPFESRLSFSTLNESSVTAPTVPFSFFEASSSPGQEDPKGVLKNGQLSLKSRVMVAMSKDLPALRVDHPEGIELRYKEGAPSIGDEAANPERRCFAIVDIASDQHKVMIGDLIMCEKLKGIDIGQKICFEQVYLLASRSKTIIGRPFVPRARVYATVEEQTKLKKIIIFKKKRRKGYKRNKGFRHEVTVLRIDSIEEGLREEGNEEEAMSATSLTTRKYSPFYAGVPGTEERQIGFVEVDRPYSKQKAPPP